MTLRLSLACSTLALAAGLGAASAAQAVEEGHAPQIYAAMMHNDSMMHKDAMHGDAMKKKHKGHKDNVMHGGAMKGDMMQKDTGPDAQ